MAKYKVEITGINTNDLKVLSNEETLELIKKYQNGNLEAKEQLITGNLKLILSVLKYFNHTNINLDDLFQIGVIGLIKAIDNFDLNYNLKLSTYAVPLIVGEIKRYIRDNSVVRVSRGTKELAYQILKFKEEYTNNYGIEPTNSLISEALQIEEYKIAYALDSLRQPKSIYEPIYNDGGDTIYLFDQLADKKEQNYDKDLKISLVKAFQKIKEREKRILINRFIVGKTQMEIALDMGISQAQVSRLEKNAINNIRKLIK